MSPRAALSVCAWCLLLATLSDAAEAATPNSTACNSTAPNSTACNSTTPNSTCNSTASNSTDCNSTANSSADSFLFPLSPAAIAACITAAIVSVGGTVVVVHAAWKSYAAGAPCPVVAPEGETPYQVLFAPVQRHRCLTFSAISSSRRSSSIYGGSNNCPLPPLMQIAAPQLRQPLEASLRDPAEDIL